VASNESGYVGGGVLTYKTRGGKAGAVRGNGYSFKEKRPGLGGGTAG